MMVNVILYKRGNEVITVVVTLKIEEKNITVITYTCTLQILFTKNVSLVKFYNKDHLNLKLVHYKKKLIIKLVGY